MNSALIIPAIEILDGRCVGLTRGDYERPTVYAEDPVALASSLSAAGVERLHVVDLDAARGTGHNMKVISAILEASPLEVQVAGGVISERAVAAHIKAGAWAVVVAAAAGRDLTLLARCAASHPGQVIAALEVRDSRSTVGGWAENQPVLMGDLLERWDALPLAGVVLTCADRDVGSAGPDLETLAMVRRMTRHFLIYAGGLTTRDDLRRAEAAGARAVILGNSLHEGRITLEQALAM